MKRFGILIIIFLVLVLMVETVVLLALVLADGKSWSPGGEKIVVVTIDDMIIDPRVYVERFEKYRDRDDVKAFVIRMETPGGTVAGSQEIAQAVNRLRADYGKVVVTSVANVGASGGYYIASQSNEIVANPGSLVGSIGVIMEHMSVEDLTKKVGLKFDAITSGEMKDAGSAVRPMTPKERAYLQALVDDAYGQFREAVLEGRRRSLAQAAGVAVDDTPAIDALLDRVADGRILTGAQAYDAGLVDKLGDLELALDVAEELAGIVDVDVIYDDPKKPFFDMADFLSRATGMVSGQQRRSFLMPGGLWYLYE